MTTTYLKGVKYHSFIRNAYGFNPNTKCSDQQKMVNLIFKEENPKAIKHKHETLLNEIKDCMKKALDYAIRISNSKEDITNMKLFYARIEDAMNSDDLLEVCSEGINVFLKDNPNSDSI